LSSSRRVKKGPGRRPQSAKRQRFVELRERGWSILAAAREVGVSRTTGNNWARGYKSYRRGRVVGSVPALERLAVRQISPRFLSQDERIEIADLRHAGWSIRQIAHRLGRAPSTVSRELRRNATRSRGYRPFDAHRHATARRARNHRRRIEINGELRQLVAELLAQRWSPQPDQSSLATEVPRAVGDVVVSREHLPGRLSGGIGTAAAISAGSAQSLPAAHRARSPARSPAHRTASGTV
jgi:transposase, IS30 family